MDFVLYFMGLMAVAVLSCGLTRMYYQHKLQLQRETHHQWYWWVGVDLKLKKEFLFAVVASSEDEARSKLGPKSLDLLPSARIKGNKGLGQGYHVLVARSLSEINIEGT